jgi:hypothetical protein
MKKKESVVKRIIPFYSQIFDRYEDDLYGFNSLAEMKYWEGRSCGVLCLKMVMEGLSNERIYSPGELIQKGISLNAYCDKGWIHKGLVKLASSYGFSGQDFRSSTISDLCNEIDQNRVCIASVTPRFLGGEKNLKTGEYYRKYGHLVVVFGYTLENSSIKSLIVHHSSFKEEYNWPNKLFEVEDYNKSFSGNFISIW